MHKTHDVFQQIREHQIVGMMLHQQMADYFDFLDLHGFKRYHCYRFYCESSGERATSKYYINHIGEILTEGHPGNPGAIPAAWSGHNRRDVGKNNRAEYVKSAIVKWVTWEQETLEMYQQAYKSLCDMGESAAAKFVLCMVKDVSHELKNAERMHLELEGIGYDASSIFSMQDELHKKYKKKIKKIGKYLA